MNDFLGKISSYNLFNYLFSGVLFVVLSAKFTSYSFIQYDIVMGVFLYYFIGLVISRIGSMIIEPLLTAVSFVKYEKYTDYIVASKKDSSLEVLSEVNNMYRTLVAVCISVLSFKFYDLFRINFIGIERYETYILIVLLLIMFLFAYRKQTAYIAKRIRANRD